MLVSFFGSHGKGAGDPKNTVILRARARPTGTLTDAGARVNRASSGLHPFYSFQRDRWNDGGMGCNVPFPTRLDMLWIPSAKA